MPCYICLERYHGEDVPGEHRQRTEEKQRYFGKGETSVPICDYEVVMIDGDYAHLRRLDGESAETKLVARALLPSEISEGCILHYEMLQYTMK